MKVSFQDGESIREDSGGRDLNFELRHHLPNDSRKVPETFRKGTLQ